jgi:hypothetical protein
VCQFLHNPTDIHLHAVKRIIKYISGTLEFGISFRKGVSSVLNKHSFSSMQLHAFCDADWAGDPNDRKSTTVCHSSKWFTCFLVLQETYCCFSFFN